MKAHADQELPELADLTRAYDANKADLPGMSAVDFLYRAQASWDLIQAEYGRGRLAELLQTADAGPKPRLPPELPVTLHRLAALCAILDRDAFPKPFFLSARAICEVFDLSHPQTAIRMMGALQAARVVARQSKGHLGRASEYRYIADMSHLEQTEDLPY